ncbi:MAG TPA: VWA domain-containing protein [Pyrinomonadaceae bacterium]|nr:VWA domain-containing protein [Pyrinomonadaceae bacterium]
MKQRFVLPVLYLLLHAAASFAQTPVPAPAPTPNDRDDVVVITTNLIQIDATVTDKNGKAVTDLRQEDFEIYQNGKSQPITNFSFITLQPDARNRPALAGGGTAADAPPVPSGRLRYQQVGRTIALVVDDLGLSFASTNWTKQALRKFVDEQLQPGDLVAIIRTSSGVGTLQQFTTDRRLLHAAIERIRWNARNTNGSFSPIEPNLSEVLSNTIDLSQRDLPGDEGEKKLLMVGGMKEEREFNRDAQESREGIFAAGTLGAVNFVMRGMGQLPGRKAVILFSDGFKLFSRKGVNTRVQDGLQKLTDTANRSGVIIYTMDPRGLDAPMLSAQDNTIGLTSDQVDALLQERSDDFSDTQQSLRAIAARTGGFSIINQNNLTKGIERILDDQKGYYLIGYKPDDDLFDIEKRRFNNLKVRVKRPGLNVRYRSGFFGLTDAEAKPQPRNAVQQLIAALTSPFTSKDIDLRLTSLFAGDSASNAFMRSLLYIKAGDLTFKDSRDGWHQAEFEVSVLTFDDTGEVVDQINRKQTVRARGTYLQNLYAHGLVCSVTLPIQKPGAYQMRAAIRDTATARIGSASQYIEVPNLKKKNLTLSGVVLQRVEAKESNPVADGKTLELKLQRDAAMRRFRQGEVVRFGFSVYNAKLDRESNQPSLLMRYKIFRDGKEIFAIQEKPLYTGEQLKVVDISDAFSLGNKMPQGDYVIQIIVKDRLGKGSGQTATQWTDFEIIP